MRSIPRTIFALAVLSPLSTAQRYNADFGSGVLPSAAFGAAAGQTGTWSFVGAPTASPPWTLTDVTPGSSNLTNLYGSTFSGGPQPASGDFPGTMGQDALLLDDYVWYPNGQPWTFFVAPLQPGTYDVYTYAHTPTGSVGISVNGSPVATVTGAWPGTYVAGVTHALHTVTVDEGLDFSIQGSAIVSGVQIVRRDTPYSGFCFGTSSACPCGNFGTLGRGCNNSIGTSGNRGAELRATGTASATPSNDTLRLSAQYVPAVAGLFFQGTTTLGGGNGVTFGDGLRCVGGVVRRIGIVTSATTSMSYPANPSDAPISAQGLVAAGDLRYYQLWYRDPPAFCTAATFNTTNGVWLTWQL